MLPWFHSVLTLLAALFLTASAGAEGMVQISLHGQITSRGGAPVEIHVGYWNGKEVVAVDLNLHVAEMTTAQDVAHLLVSRLKRAGARVEYPAANASRPDPVQIFIEHTTLVSFRLGHGLWAGVTTCESGPEAIRFQIPLLQKESADISVCTTTFHPHTRKPGRTLLELDVDEFDTSGAICEVLFNQGLAKGLIGDRPSADRWRPVKGTDGSQVTGFSIELLSPGADWGLEVMLSVPR